MVSDKNIARFKRATKQLNKVMSECAKEHSGVAFYLDGSSSFFMLDGTRVAGEEGVEDTIIACENLDAGGGDW